MTIAIVTVLSLFFSNEKNSDFFSFGIAEPHAFHKSFISVVFIISTANLFNGVGLHEIALCVISVLAGLSIYFLHEKFTFSDLKSSMILMIFLIVLHFLIKYKFSNTEYIGYVFLAALLGLAIYFVYKAIEKIMEKLVSKKEMKNINYGEFKNREYIHQILGNKKLTESDKCKILDYIEDNVSLASGAWPDMSLFDIHNNSASCVRVFLLEEKWKEQEESKI